MKPQQSLAAVLVKFGVFAAAMVLLLVLVVQAITRPVGGATDRYLAEFTDVSGLKAGDDVRMFGVRVGKVAAIRLDRYQALVTFTVQRGRPVYEASVLAIRYQSLTGQRYIDVRQPNRPAAVLSPGARIGVDHTVASFDITALFNGLEPVLREFSPAAVNQFDQSVLAVIEGDGSGIGPALDAIGTLSDYVSDRQGVLSLLLRNLRDISDEINGRAPYLVILIRGLSDVFAALQNQMTALVDYGNTAPDVFGPISDLALSLGLTAPTNPNLDHDLRRLFPDLNAARDVLGRLPGLLQVLDTLLPAPGPVPGSVVLTCSRGRAAVPAVVDVLIAGQRISICNG